MSLKANSNVVSLSGGKDSTAMLLMMLERGEPIADIVFFDTGWEFPQMYEHLDLMEQLIGRKITRLRPRLHPRFQTNKSPFDFIFSEYPAVSRKTGKIHKIGRGWPNPLRRWCTGNKQAALKSHILSLTHRSDIVLPLNQCVGFAADEEERIDGPTKASKEYVQIRFPLIEWGITEEDALSYCHNWGFTWGGLYEVFERVSCFCCPLGGVERSRKLRQHYPLLWQKMLEMESWLPEGDLGRRFEHKNAVSDLESRFIEEDMQGCPSSE